MEQWITIRGRDSRNPILLFLHGGPGAAQSGTAPLFAPWEETFTIVHWDQPMSGATYAKNIGKDVGPLTIERYTRDGIAVIEHVLKKLGARKLVVMGASWGSELGLIIANRRPDLIAAYVGTAQAVSGPRGLAIGRDQALEAARKRGDAAAVAALERIGRPPYATFEDFLVHAQETFWRAYRHLATFQAGGRFLSWLFRIAFQVFVNDRRTRRFVPEPLPAALESPVNEFEGAVSRRTFEQLMMHLAPGERAAIVLHYQHGMSHSEIADSPDLPLGTVKTVIREDACGPGRDDDALFAL